MTPSHATSKRRRYRYYVTRPEVIVETSSVAWRVSAHDLEAIVIKRVIGLLSDRLRLHDLIARHADDAGRIDRGIREAGTLATILSAGPSADVAELLQFLIRRVALHEHHLDVEVERTALLARLGITAEAADDEIPIVLECETARVRRGHELRLILSGDSSVSTKPIRRDEKLVALLAEAPVARQLVSASPERTLASIAAQAGRCRTRLTKLVGLSCLAPSIVLAILEGRQPESLNTRRLLAADLPLVWDEQRTLLGVA